MTDGAANPFVPALLRLPDKPCLVVGGGPVATRKVLWLLDAAARVLVVSPEIDARLARLAADSSGTLAVRRERYATHDLTAYALAIAATDDEALNRLVHDDARRAGIPVNVVDVPELCSFYVPGVVRRGPLTICVSTGGRSPALAARLRRELDERYPAHFGAYAEALGRVRDALRELGWDAARRADIIRALCSEDAEESVRDLDEDGMFDRLMETAAKRHAP
jgi:siroheme synthase-like protein